MCKLLSSRDQISLEGHSLSTDELSLQSLTGFLLFCCWALQRGQKSPVAQAGLGLLYSPAWPWTWDDSLVYPPEFFTVETAGLSTVDYLCIGRIAFLLTPDTTVLSIHKTSLVEVWLCVHICPFLVEIYAIRYICKNNCMFQYGLSLYPQSYCFFRVWVLQVCISAVEILHIMGKGYCFVTL